jgi:hypothetical protein
VLFDAMIAVAASHHANTNSQCPVSKGTDGLPLATSCHHSLVFKQRALNHLSQCLDDPSQRHRVPTIASILLLVLLDLLEAGSETWNSHLGGAKYLLTPAAHINCESTTFQDTQGFITYQFQVYAPFATFLGFLGVF